MQKQLAELLQDPEKLRAFLQSQAGVRMLRGGMSGEAAGVLGSAVGGGAAAIPMLGQQ
jgi:hypothetical protein